MVPHDELVMLIIGVVALASTIGLRHQLRRIHHWRLLLLGFAAMLLGWAATVVEHLAFVESMGLGELGNYFEHTCYAVGALSVAAWCWRGDDRGAEER